jgi:hypothetical protein
MHKLHSGGISRAIRCICVISAVTAGPTADTKCHVGSFSHASRRQFSGNNAIFAANAVTTATEGSPLGQRLQYFHYPADFVEFLNDVTSQRVD